jgi:hypothetical protein
MYAEGKYNVVFLGVPFITVLLYALYTTDVEFKYKLPSSRKDQIDAKVSNLYMGRKKGGGGWGTYQLVCQLLNTEQAYLAYLFYAEYLSHNSFQTFCPASSNFCHYIS